MTVLNEGLISTPPEMEAHIMFLLKYHVLWWAKDRMKGKTREYPDLAKALKAEIFLFGEDIPSSPYHLPKQVAVSTIPVDLTGMPDQYQNLTPTEKNIYFAIDWREGATMHGGWMQRNKALIVYPMSFDWMKRYPSATTHKDDLRIFLTDMAETIQHELRHMVQYVIINQPDQTKKKIDYEKHGRAYFSSPVEFDPMIGSAVHEFMNLWRTATEDGRNQNIDDAVRKYLAIKPSGTFGFFTPNRLFKHLRNDSPERYKIAVKKFMVELKKVMHAAG